MSVKDGLFSIQTQPATGMFYPYYVRPGFCNFTSATQSNSTIFLFFHLSKTSMKHCIPDTQNLFHASLHAECKLTDFDSISNKMCQNILPCRIVQKSYFHNFNQKFRILILFPFSFFPSHIFVSSLFFM